MARNRRRNDEIFEESLFNNMSDYDNFLARLIDLAVGRIRIRNLPREIWQPFMLRKIITDNEVVFFKDEELDKYIAYTYTIGSGKLNIYNRPTNYRVYCPNGYQRNDLTDENAVIIRSSLTGLPIMNIIEGYARKLYIISRTIDINVNAQKTPVLMLCDENERLSLEQVYQKYVGNQPIIKASRNFDINGITALKTDAPIVFDKLYELQSMIWNEYLTFLGITNVSEKKERMNTDEVNRLLGGTMVMRDNYCTTMYEGIKQANEMFGLNMELYFGGEKITDEEQTVDETTEVVEEESEVTENE